MQKIKVVRPTAEEIEKLELSPRLETYYKAGFWKPGWELTDYLRFAALNMRWECIPIWGIKGSFKSNRLLALLYSIYQDWEKVHEHIVMTPEEFASLLKTEGRIPAIGWDDIGAWLDAQLYFENRSLYTRIKRAWKLMRTKLSVFLCTSPLKTDLPTFILEDMTSEVFCSPEMTLTYDRWTWQKDLKEPRKVVKRPVNICLFKPFDVYEVPTREFKRYWDRRLALSDIGREQMINIMEEAFAEPEEETDEEKRVMSEAARMLVRKRWAKAKK